MVIFLPGTVATALLPVLEPEYDTGGITEIVLTVSARAGLQIVHLCQANADYGSDIQIKSAADCPGSTRVRTIDSQRAGRGVRGAAQCMNEGREVSRVRQTQHGAENEVWSLVWIGIPSNSGLP